MVVLLIWNILNIFDFDKEVYFASSGAYYIQYFYGFCMIFNIKKIITFKTLLYLFIPIKNFLKFKKCSKR